METIETVIQGRLKAVNDNTAIMLGGLEDVRNRARRTELENLLHELRGKGLI